MERTPDPSVEELIVQLRAKVEEREREGLYPVDLAHQLHEHFRRIAAHRTAPDLDDLRAQLDVLDGASAFGASRISLDSGMPGGTKLHAVVAKAVARQTQGILEQMQQFADAVRVVLRTTLAALEEPHAHVHADLVGQIDSLFERLASFERGPTDSKVSVADLRLRLEQLERLERSRRFSPFFSNERFEEAFRGSRAELLEWYRDLAGRFEEGPVLDIGCGRGEFLELLGARGVQATGVEIDPDLVEDCRSRGLQVVQDDAVAVLRSTPDQTLGGVVLIQVIEHLSPQEAVELVALAHDKLRVGGRLVVETVNPQSLYVFAHAFYVDPTHTQPVHPAYLNFVAQEAGFSRTEIDWRSPPPEEDVLDDVPADDELGKIVNENVRRLNALLFAPQDYALIATR